MDADRLPVLTMPIDNSFIQEPEEGADDKQYYAEEDFKGDIDQKGDGLYKDATLDIHSVEGGYIPGDPLKLSDEIPEEDTQFTIRAVFVGLCLGALVQASNLYLGLKTGFTFGPQLLGGIGGFLALKPLSRVIPKALPAWCGTGYFGPRENVTCQSAATAAGGLGILFVSGFPAMYQIGLLSAKPSDDIGKLIGYMISVAFYGMTFAVPLRTFFILRQRLTFPTPSATAYAIRSLHATGTGAADAKLKGRWIFYTFLVCFLQKVGSTYVPGLLYDWHIFYWIASWGGTRALYADNWGFLIEITPAFFGAGILSGLNASFSFYGGSILAWAIIGPALIGTGRAVGKDISGDATGKPLPYVTYWSLTTKDPKSVNCSPRYNLLWIGVLVMLVAAFVELAVEWRVIASGFSPIILRVRNLLRARSGKEAIVGDERPVVDPAPKKDRVPFYVWGTVTAIAIFLTCLVQGVAFHVNVGYAILAIILAFLFSFIGVLSAGVTDINPVSTCAKATQLILGGATHGKYPTSLDPTTGYNDRVLRVNLFSGMIACAAAAQASDLTGDLKTGHLIGAKPIAQYFAQLCGAFVSCFLSVAFFILFTTASPCIIDLDALTCQYSVPSASAWRAVAVAVTSVDGLPVPKTSGILAIVLAIVGAGLIIFRAWFCPPKYKAYVPNPSAVGLAFVVPQTQYGLAMCVGATGAYFWKRRNPAKFEAVGYAFAAGLLTGEGLGGVMQAVLTVANAGIGKIQTVGCPGTGC